MIQPPVKDIAEHILSEAAGKDRLLVAIAGPPGAALPSCLPLVARRKYKDRQSYGGSGAKAVYVGTRPTGKAIRFWFAKKAAATVY